MNKVNIRKNNYRVGHDYKFGDKVILDNNAACKYKTPYKGPFEIMQSNGMIPLQHFAIKIGNNVRQIKTHTYNTNVEDIKCLEPTIDDTT